MVHGVFVSRPYCWQLGLCLYFWSLNPSNSFIQRSVTVCLRLCEYWFSISLSLSLPFSLHFRIGTKAVRDKYNEHIAWKFHSNCRTRRRDRNRMEQKKELKITKHNECITEKSCANRKRNSPNECTWSFQWDKHTKFYRFDCARLCVYMCMS